MTAPSWLESPDNPYLEGAFAPVFDERDDRDLRVTGEIPRDLAGIFVRNGPNPRLEPRGRYHWFDGDGMLHAVEFEDGRARYRNRWIATEAFAAEGAAGRALWPGYMEPRDPEAPPGAGSDGWLKDTANTDVVFHSGALLALWYQCGLPYRVDARSLETLGPERFGGALPRAVSAHAKVDEATGELLFFDYATQEPYLVHHLVSPEGTLVRSTPVDVPGPRLPHDMAITERYSILMDLPLFWDARLLRKGIHRLRFHDDVPSRFAVLPRDGSGPVRWFEAEPTYIYHVVNSWEEGDTIVMDAFRVRDPGARPVVGDGPLARMLGTLKLDACLRRWRLDLATGQTKEEDLDDRNAEFPSIDASRLGRPTRYAYAPSIAADPPTLCFDGIVKYDTAEGRTSRYACGPGRFASESPFAPRPNARDEDDGYVVSFVTDARENRSEVLVLDAKNLDAEPLARVHLPRPVPIGFHACWVPAEKLPAR